MQNQPYVSIIVPVYNTEQYLKRCLDSLINQTLYNIEIICINDGSTDNSLQILKDYANNDKRIVLVNIRNSGAAHARNIGIAKATGDYIGFCDSDDYVDLEYFENLYNFTKINRFDIIRGIRVLDVEHFQGKNKYGCIVPSIIKKHFLLKSRVKFPEYLKKGEDSTFRRLLYHKNPSIFETPDNNIYYHYMRREGSLSKYTLADLNLKK